MNASIESPSPGLGGNAITPMKYKGFSGMDSPELRTTPLVDRSLAQTPKIKGVPPHQLHKFKKARQNGNLKDMVVIYADMGGKHLRQKNVAQTVR